MTKPVVAIFCSYDYGHFRPLRPLIYDLAQSGFAVHVFTHKRFGPDIERCGGTAIDLFGKYPLDPADPESMPRPLRYVTFAAVYADDVLEDLKKIRPALVIYETFSVIGRLTAQLLGIPYVNVSPGYNIDPARFMPMVQADPRVKISETCRRSVATLRERYGLTDASPFSYITSLSPYLNICIQPANFITEEERKPFEPVAFYGCLESEERLSPPAQDPRRAYFADNPAGLRVYACLGTVGPKHFPDVAIGALQALSDAVESLPQARALISLGGTELPRELLRCLAKTNVEVVDFVDQWEVLKVTDIFLTHHGINSTHEAIFHRVPMLSYPLFWDQPFLAERCREFGLAVPLAESLREPVEAGQVRSALESLLQNDDAIKAKMEQAKSWELEVIAQRPSCLERIFDLVGVR